MSRADMAFDQCQNINALDVYGYTALYWASLMGHHEVVQAARAVLIPIPKES